VGCTTPTTIAILSRFCFLRPGNCKRRCDIRYLVVVVAAAAEEEEEEEEVEVVVEEEFNQRYSEVPKLPCSGKDDTE